MWKLLPIAAVLGVGAIAAADTPRYVIPEHKLQVVESPAKAERDQVSEELLPMPEWDWPKLHAAEGSRFVDPFVATDVFPQVWAGTGVTATHVRDGKRLAFQDQVSLSLYALDVRVPIISSLDTQATTPSVQFDIKIPFALPGAPDHRLALAYGAVVMNGGPSLSETSRGQLIYGFGSQVFSLTLHAGYGAEQLFADQPPRLGFLYGGTIGVRLGSFQPMVEADGVRVTVSRADRLAVMPGLRFFPGNGNNLEMGLAALLNMTRGEESPGVRYGGIADIRYNFL